MKEENHPLLIPPGYKQTEVGVIPEDWNATPLRQTCRAIYRGASPRPIGDPRWFDQGSDIGWVRISDVTRSRRHLRETTQRLSEEGMRRSRFVPLGSLIMSICATVGRPIETAINTCIHDGFVVFENPGVDQGFLYHTLCDLEPRWATKGQTGSQMNLNTNLIKITSIPLPPTSTEQRAIAIALSDVDALLDGLDRLITKKRNLKQAAMQQLLTGKTRLPGFSGEWQKKNLRELGATYGGLTGKTKSDFEVGTAKYITFMNVMTNTVIDCAACEQVNVSASETQNRVLRGDLLFNGSSETPEEVALCSLMTEEVPDLYLNSFCFGFRLFDDQQVDGLFLTYYIRANPGREMMKSLAQGSTRYNLSKTALCEASVLLPLKDEQTAIATVLSDMDAEIAALEARCDKTRNIKQGMMQELLTGKTRLV